MTYKILKYGNPILEKPSDPVDAFDAELDDLIDGMFETMWAAKGVGLAAPQVGVSKQLTVIDVSAGEDPAQKIVLINPEITVRDGKQTGEEGCLSIPGFREEVTRSQKATVRALDRRGQPIEVTGEDLLARAIQHEIDHLRGILFLQHLSPLKRDMIRRKIRKMIKAGEW